MNELILKPAPGLEIRKPEGGFLKTEGEQVAPLTYWMRRLRAGDVLPAAPPAPEAETKSETKSDPKTKK